MLLGRLRVREKLALLVMLPLIAVVGTAAPLVVGRLQAVAKASRSADVVSAAVQVGTLIQQLQQERLLSLGYLATGGGRDRLVVRSAEVEDSISQVGRNVGSRVSPLLLPALETVTALDLVRTRVLRRDIDPDTLFTAYGNAIGVLIDAISLHQDANTATATGRQELALDALIRHDEATSAAGAALFVGFAGRDQIDARVVALVSAAASVQDTQERLFLALASTSAKTLYRLVQEGPASQGVQRYLSRVTGDPIGVIGDKVTDDLLPGVESLTTLGRLVQIKIARDVSRESTSAANRAATTGGAVILVGLLLLGLVVTLSVLVARAIANPLRRLTASAEAVADVAQNELVRVSDEEDLEVAAPHLVPVEVGTSDELGELAAAFNRVQQVAAELVERQLVSRRNVATMFGNVGRRTQNLVGRQLAMIDTLERDERDTAVLERLYRLDHVSTRLRRNANSLVVLSGAVEPSMASEPLSIADAIRSALGEIEGFQRVRLRETDEARLAPDVATDVMLLLAELLENSTSFSPPHTEVNVTAHVVDAGCLVTVVDHGIGMTEQQLADENARLVQRERLDLAPTDVLGLFVVGRLARRHGIDVLLRPTAGTGVTAEVTIPRRCLVSITDGTRPNWLPGRPSGPVDTAPGWSSLDQPDHNGHGLPQPATATAPALPALPTRVRGESSFPAPAVGRLAPTVEPEAPPDSGRPDLNRPAIVQPDRPGSGPAGRTRQVSFHPTDAPTGPAQPGAPQPPTHGRTASFRPADAPAPAATPPVSFRPSDGPERSGPGQPESFRPADEPETPPGSFHPLDEPAPGRPDQPAPFRPAGEPAQSGPGQPAPVQPDESGESASGRSRPAGDAGSAPDLPGSTPATVPAPTDLIPPAADLTSPRPGGAPEPDRTEPSAGPEAGATPPEPTASPAASATAPGAGTEQVAGPQVEVTRRVPGAQLPDPGPAAAPSWSLRETPEAARRVVRDFEAGVDRAEQVALRRPGPADSEADLPLLDRWERLRRRVPGAQLPPTPSSAEPGEPPATPDSGRALVEEFETGVKRALDNLAAVTARQARTAENSGASESPFVRPTSDATPQQSPEPPAAQSSAAPQPAAQPPPGQSSAAQPSPAQPPSTQPSPGQSAAAQPPPAQPPSAQPPSAQPASAQLPAAQPAAAQPASAQPASGQSPSAQPAPQLAAVPPPAAEPGPQPSARPKASRHADEPPPSGRRRGTLDAPLNTARASRPADVPSPPTGRRAFSDPSIRLNRRVPGAQLPDTGFRADDLAPPPTLDPEAARALVEEFEAGVARAMESAPDRRTSTGGPEGTGSTEGSER